VRALLVAVQPPGNGSCDLRFALGHNLLLTFKRRGALRVP
jgi:hypothetical protein